MEAVKKLPMISFELKNSPDATSFHNLKQCISEYYHEDPNSYTKEFIELEKLRGLACRPRADIECVAAMKRYYAQLHSLENRFPLSSENELIEFSWKDIYSSYNFKTNSIKYEMASTLYNIAALYTQLAVEESREEPESMKLACTYFQCASWAFGELKSQYSDYLRGDLCSDLMIYKQNICLAQAQECILEKSLADNRKAQIVAKVTAQVILFYTSAVTALYGQNEDGLIQDFIGSKLYKDWTRYIKFKTSYLSSILFLQQGIHSEEQRKMGERVALFNAACDKLEEAKKESKGMNRIDVINEAMVLMTDIVEGKRKNAKQENEFIYHESIPEVSSLSAVQGACLVQGIPFDVTDSQVIGEDIFKRLVPMKAHEHLSVYSEEKANILRSLGGRIDERDAELHSFMGSLNKDMLKSMDDSYDPIPQPVVDRCAELSAKPNAIPDLVESMANLAEMSIEVESSLTQIKNILDEEAKRESEFQKQMGRRPTGHMSELTREYTKYIEAHIKASDSNDTLRKAMELHVSNLRILAQPLISLRSQVPQADPIDASTRKELHVLLNKVEEMKNQRDDLFNALREDILNRDDITAQLIAHGEKNVEELFKKELGKYGKSVKVIEMNLEAQGNILKALTDTYAKHAMTLKAYNDTKLKRDHFYSSLVTSYDIYEDLMSKSVKGLDFYKKLQSNIMKLLSRVKAARDVQEEERQQLLRSLAPKVPQQINDSSTKPVDKSYRGNTMTSNTTPINTMSGGGMKLKDYLKNGMVPGMNTREDSTKLPAVRPSPLGQENISSTNPISCQSMNMTQYPINVGYQNYQVHQPPMDQQSNGSGSMSSSTTSLSAGDVSNPGMHIPNQGYVNPIYQNQQVDFNAINQYSGNYGAVSLPSNQSTMPSQQQHQLSDYYRTQTQSQAASHQTGSSQSRVDSNNSFYSQNYPPQSQFPNQSYYQQYASNQTPSYPAAQSPALNPPPYSVNQNQTPSYPAAQSPALNPPPYSLNQNQTPSYPAAQSPALNPPPYSLNQNQTPSYPAAQSPALNPPPYSVNQNQTPNYNTAQSPALNTNTSQYSANQNPNYPVALSPALSNNTQQYHQSQPLASTLPPQSHSTQNYVNQPQSVSSQPVPTTQYQQPQHQVPTTSYINQMTTTATTSSFGQPISNHQANVQSNDQQQSYTNYQNQTYHAQNMTMSNNQYGNQQATAVSNQTYTLPTTTPQSQYPTNFQQNQPQIAQQANAASTENYYYPNSALNSQLVQQQQQQPMLNQQEYPPNSNFNNFYGQNTNVQNGYNNSGYSVAPNTTPLQDQQPQLQSNIQSQTSQPNYQQPPATPSVQPPANHSVPEAPKSSKRSSNIDLLADIDFSISSIPTLTPMKTEESPKKIPEPLTPVEIVAPVTPIKLNDDLADLDLSVSSMSISQSETPQKNVLKESKKIEDPFESANVLKQFHKEVESLEKFMETVTVKTLSGVTPLVNKWKELQDKLAKDESKRTVVVAKLFPEKNRNVDYLPYDHARISLPSSTDNYINAAVVKDCGKIPFIITPTPLVNTVNDYWEMVYSQNANVLVCLHTVNEILDPFWPQNIGEEKSYGEVSVTFVQQFEFSHSIEKVLKISKHGSDGVLNLSLIQVKTWLKNNAEHVVNVASNILTSYKQRNPNENSQQSPIVLNCLTGCADRSGIVTLGICAILASQMKKPILLNVVDHWYRICSQRKSVLENEKFIQLSLEIVLNNAHRILNKRGIMTTYQVKTAEKAGPIVTETESVNKDTGLDSLDPFWKFK